MSEGIGLLCLIIMFDVPSVLSNWLGSSSKHEICSNHMVEEEIDWLGYLVQCFLLSVLTKW